MVQNRRGGRSITDGDFPSNGHPNPRFRRRVSGDAMACCRKLFARRDFRLFKSAEGHYRSYTRVNSDDHSVTRKDDHVKRTNGGFNGCGFCDADSIEKPLPDDDPLPGEMIGFRWRLFSQQEQQHQNPDPTHKHQHHDADLASCGQIGSESHG